MSQNKKVFPQKEDFPDVIQDFYLSPPLNIHGFNPELGCICLLIKENIINDQKKGVFSLYNGKRPDEIHYSIGIGLIEEKTTNYGISKVESQLKDFKHYFENKFVNNKYCQVKYCVLVAKKLSQKMTKEIKINKSKKNLLYYKHNGKPFKIGKTPVYFVMRSK